MACSHQVVARRRSARSLRAALKAIAAAPVLTALSCLTVSCGGGGSGRPDDRPLGNSLRIEHVEYGRLVDLYALGEAGAELVERDVVVAVEPLAEPGIASDELRTLRPDADTLQPRLLIRAPAESKRFAEVRERLERGRRKLTPQQLEAPDRGTPWSVVARDAALLVRFTKDLPVGPEFFVRTDEESGRVEGILNLEAVQLLEVLVPDPPGGALRREHVRPIPLRIAAKPRALVLDPVLLGSEAVAYGRGASPSGMPASAHVGAEANLRLAIALRGPLAIPGMHEDEGRPLSGENSLGDPAVVRDFRSGSGGDNSPWIAKGFLRDAGSPRLIGEIPMYVLRVEDQDAERVVVEIDKGGVVHQLDLGDGLRVELEDGTILRSEIVEEPADDEGQPEQQIVRAVCTRVAGLRALPRAPSGAPREGAARRAWLRANATPVVLETAFTLTRRDDAPGDDPRWFVRFDGEDGEQLLDPEGGHDRISPFAGVTVRFSEPVDAASVRSLDSFFVATRNVLDLAEAEAFRIDRGIHGALFDMDRYRATHLVPTRATAVDGAQTSFRLAAPLGYYLDERMRSADEGQVFGDKRFRYHLHLVASDALNAVTDPAGNPLDLDDQSGTGGPFVVPFALDTGRHSDGTPVWADNLVAGFAQRFASLDEDPRPSLYRPEESSDPGDPRAWSITDVFGGVVPVSGRLVARGTSRVQRAIDSEHQAPVPPQSAPDRHCPTSINDPDRIWGREQGIASPSAAIPFSQGTQNPWNPFGARVQAVWREIDFGFSKTDPFDYDLDVEAMWWAPFQGDPTYYDIFDRVSLDLGHSEWRPEPCIGTLSSLAVLRTSGLKESFAGNYLGNVDGDDRRSGPAPHIAYRDRQLIVDGARAIGGPSGAVRYLPLPDFQEPYFTWRDQRVKEQGGSSLYSGDTRTPGGSRDYDPYILSPFLGGAGTDYRVVGGGSGVTLLDGTWNNLGNTQLSNSSRLDTITEGGLAAFAMPLLADFQTWPDSPDLPAQDPFLADGFNGWQISLTVQSAPFFSRPDFAPPFFRAYSAGWRKPGEDPVRLQPGDPAWQTAMGGWDFLRNRRSIPYDPATYWVMADFVKRRTVATPGFVDLYNPLRMPVDPDGDPRLGPFFGGSPQLGVLPRFSWATEPFGSEQAGGASAVVEFRVASQVDQAPWRALNENYPLPTVDNVPLDPRIAGDAHIRKWDDRIGAFRYLYHEHVSGWHDDVDELFSQSGLDAHSATAWAPRDVQQFGWRFVLTNGGDVAPELDSFWVAWRFERE